MAESAVLTKSKKYSQIDKMKTGLNPNSAVRDEEMEPYEMKEKEVVRKKKKKPIGPGGIAGDIFKKKDKFNEEGEEW